MMTIMGKQFSKRGVSVIIAALLLIAIAVAAAVLLYVFSIGLMGSLGSSGGSQTKDQLIMAAYNWGNSGTIILYVQNVGSSKLSVFSADGASYFVNGALVTGATGGTSACVDPLLPGTAACSVSLTGVPPTGSVAGDVTPGAAYPVKIVTPDGGVFSYTAIAGQSS